MALPVLTCAPPTPSLHLDYNRVAKWLVRFLRHEMVRRRGISRGVVGVSGGVDSAVTTYLAVQALGPNNVYAYRLPYRLSAPDSLSDAQIVIDALGIPAETIDITSMVDGYASARTDMTPHRLGNLCSRCRATILFDQAVRLGALPLGTGNKTERLLGYYTWHGDDSPPINPLGDLFKTQVWGLARHLGVPAAIIDKPPTADLIPGQTDEDDFGVTYAKADAILSLLIQGYSEKSVTRRIGDGEAVRRIAQRLNTTHWKRRLPTTAMLSTSAIGESFLRPVDY